MHFFTASPKTRSWGQDEISRISEMLSGENAALGLQKSDKRRGLIGVNTINTELLTPRLFHPVETTPILDFVENAEVTLTLGLE
jgi:hypothetical protein